MASFLEVRGAGAAARALEGVGRDLGELGGELARAHVRELPRVAQRRRAVDLLEAPLVEAPQLGVEEQRLGLDVDARGPDSVDPLGDERAEGRVVVVVGLPAAALR
jgi:hypothetical protein